MRSESNGEYYSLCWEENTNHCRQNVVRQGAVLEAPGNSLSDSRCRRSYLPRNADLLPRRSVHCLRGTNRRNTCGDWDGDGDTDGDTDADIHGDVSLP